LFCGSTPLYLGDHPTPSGQTYWYQDPPQHPLLLGHDLFIYIYMYIYQPNWTNWSPMLGGLGTETTEKRRASLTLETENQQTWKMKTVLFYRVKKMVSNDRK
jgi:hypothetical protein